MNNRIFATISSLTLLTTAAAFGQSRTTLYNIPFAFSAGTTMLPAGQYEVCPQFLQGALSIQRFDRKGGAFVPTQAVSAGKPQNRRDKNVLVFHRYGDQYFLSQAWTAGYEHGRQLGKSKAERELASTGWQAPPLTVALAVR